MAHISLNISNNLTNIKCRFAKNDKNIILNEAESGDNRSISICACSFFVAVFLGISIIFGILLVHRYKYEDESEKKEIIQNQKNLSETAEKIDEKDNQTTLNINNLNDLENNNNANVDVINK